MQYSFIYCINIAYYLLAKHDFFLFACILMTVQIKNHWSLLTRMEYISETSYIISVAHHVLYLQFNLIVILVHHLTNDCGGRMHLTSNSCWCTLSVQQLHYMNYIRMSIFSSMPNLAIFSLNSAMSSTSFLLCTHIMC